jgi:hypothetical protein
MDIPIGAEVKCADGPGGHSTCVILNPVTRRVTHVVVKEAWFPHVEHLVPVDLVAESTPHQIHLRCTTKDLAELDSFIEAEFIQSEDPFHIYDMEEYRLWPYVQPEDEMLPIEFERVPPRELAIHQGAHVQARDGQVGQVDEFLVNVADGHITHLVLREGHLWGQKDVTERIEEDTVRLRLDRASVEALPAVPVRRSYG